MKIKVVEDFIDKYSGEQYRKGMILDVSDERAKELLKTTLCITIPTKSKSESKK